ncbi:NgoMIV family type II restriction endonuclease [Corynebacterium cystitidis]|uniref:NgoMIV restriction enzyme n=1 Tax=Corynebacterium cystitidis DSM 20524 TaxID=1121357 RepID=A0A1H9RYU4_9CORY|nr:NgoMIV family type II restriction endonuclease [Corynebacterium cystitidis]WJY82130.1 Type-2 restriction enzyme NgoMIV [Corynebacterium cystitidis DSM 20524]SER77565.1 NgoMIV restriction enzyme [Corynebacterium cystitidis DSM 20524]SNV78886.1 DNA restriction-modification system, restriction enzyme [Corynebacterium cystitidis]
MAAGIITEARQRFHQSLIDNGTLAFTSTGKHGKVASNADKSQRQSVEIAEHLGNQLGVQDADKLTGQTQGKNFEEAVEKFLAQVLEHVGHLRPGTWHVVNVGGSRSIDHLANFEPYRHLAQLEEAIEKTPELLSVLGNSYAISPDLLVTLDAFSDEQLNAVTTLVDKDNSHFCPIRAINHPNSLTTTAFVHAVISCKWTMRSDRSQNTRSETLNLIRNRKGRAPHMVAVTAEPTPSRISSLALGTGDIDMVYHFALDELIVAVTACGDRKATELLKTLVNGNRLRDISDLPLDLLV